MDELQPRRGPGRPPKSDDLASGVEATLQRKSNRKPFGSLQQKLARPRREGFRQHWFNDVAGRISRAQEAGYEHVKDRDGKIVCETVGVAEAGGPLKAYLMEIPQEWYQEDMAAQQAENDERMAAIKNPRAGIKDADPRDHDKFYLGKEGSSIKRS